MTTGPLASGGLVAPGPAYVVGSGPLTAAALAAAKSTLVALLTGDDDALGRDAVFESLRESLATAVDAARWSFLVQRIVENRTGRKASWQAAELAVQFEARERESGEADEVLAATEALLSELGCGGVRLAAVPTRWEELASSPPNSSRLEALKLRQRGLTYEQIADELGTSKSTAHRLVDLAIKEYREAALEDSSVLKPAPAYTALSAKVGSKGKRRQW